MRFRAISRRSGSAPLSERAARGDLFRQPKAIHTRLEIAPSGNATNRARRGETVFRPDGRAAVCGHVVDLMLILARLADRSNGIFLKRGKNSAGRFSGGLFWGFRTPFAPQKSQKSRPKSGGLHDPGRRLFQALDPTVGEKASEFAEDFLVRSQDCFRARTLASNILIFGASGSPARMNPWPAPS